MTTDDVDGRSGLTSTSPTQLTLLVRCQAENEEPGVMLPGHCFTIEVSTRKGKGGKREASQLLRHVPRKKNSIDFFNVFIP